MGVAEGDAGRQRQHAVDRLIRELVRNWRPVSDDEIEQVVARIADAPFSPEVVPVPVRHRRLAYAGHLLGAREPSLLLHLVRRVLVDEQWAPGTTADEYLADLHAAARDPAARVAVYYRTGQFSAAVLAPNRLPPARCGAQPEVLMLVVYSADRGTITTGYQVSSVATVNLPATVRWLR